MLFPLYVVQSLSQWKMLKNKIKFSMLLCGIELSISNGDLAWYSFWHVHKLFLIFTSCVLVVICVQLVANQVPYDGVKILWNRRLEKNTTWLWGVLPCLIKDMFVDLQCADLSAGQEQLLSSLCFWDQGYSTQLITGK